MIISHIRLWLEDIPQVEEHDGWEYTSWSRLPGPGIGVTFLTRSMATSPALMQP